MSSHWETVWEFNTARFRIVGEVTPCEDDPDGQFDNRADIDMIRNGEVEWFDARVRVLLDDEEVGADYLGCCSYYRHVDLFRHHATLTAELRSLRGRTDRKSRRTRKGIRETLANNIKLSPPVVYCEYGPSMVQQAIADARATLARLRTIRLRDTGRSA